MKQELHRSVWGFLMILLLLIACNSNSQKKSLEDSLAKRKKEIIDISIPGGFSAQKTLHFDSSTLDEFLDQFPSFKIFRKDIVRFYSEKDYAYAWYDTGGMIEQADNLYNRINNIHEEGLPDKIPYRDSFRVLMDSLRAISSNDLPNTKTELMLTSQYFAYARITWQGLDETESKELEWFLPRRKVDLAHLIDSLLTDEDALIDREPLYRQYGLLKFFLKKYRDIETNTNWKPIKSDKKKYIPGDSSPVIKLIKERLFRLGDISSNNQSPFYEAELENGIKGFQQRSGLKQDGIVGPNFLKEINYPISKRIEQIIVNMERCRWLPTVPEGDYLVVNIPNFTLHALRNDSLLWSMEVVVGKAVNKTAVFSGELKYVVFSPYWNVPPGILKNEILPAILRNPNYLANHNMEWYGNSVRQRPGPDNPLGLVKFLFPNSYNIYLHDTPAKSLFSESKRAFSHGCIRVSRARDMAKWILRNYPQWTDEKIDEAMHSGIEQFFTLRNPIPVYIVYFTAFVDRGGKLHFRDDVYKRDSRLADMILEEGK